MIQPVNINVNYGSKAKKGIAGKGVDAVKHITTASGIAAGAAKGAAKGVVVTAGVGIIAKNAVGSKGTITGTVAGSIQDAFKAAKTAVKSVPDLISKAPAENLKNALSLPKKFYKDYMKGNKAAAVVATFAGLGVLAANVIKGKINANYKNADLDHKTNSGHQK